MRQRSRLAIRAGDFLELVAAAAAVAGVYGLAGVWWALIAAAVLIAIGAELIYGEEPNGAPRVWRIPLPRRPQPRRVIEERRQRLSIWRYRRLARWRARSRA